MRNTVMAMLEEDVIHFPDKTALADENRSFTYAEYIGGAVRIAEAVRSQVGPGVHGKPVGVWIDRNAPSVVAFLGVAYSGNFYVPLDHELPAGRLSMILEELSPVMTLDARDNPGKTPVPCGAPRLDISPFLLPPAPGPAQEPDAVLARARQLREAIVDTDPLYAVFTSGSTGVPKGILVSHRSVLDLVDAFAEVFGFAGDTVFGNQAPFDYDGSVKDIYNSLRCGGRVEVIPHRMFVMPALLVKHMAQRGVNTIFWAVSALRIVADLKALEDLAPGEIPLRHALFSGEVMPVKVVNYWIRYFPDAVFVNLYGPSEITCNCTYYILEGHYANDQTLPIGRAFPNTRVFLLEAPAAREEAEAAPAETAAAPQGDGRAADPDPSAGHRVISPDQPFVRGEICVEGSCVALGYWNNPARTAESFVENPAAPFTLQRIYRTGDLGYYDDAGQLFFAARADNQIKHMGHRIELGEIESALNAIPFIDIAFCFFDEKKKKIVCVYQAAGDEKKAIIEALSDRLPKFMRPNKYLRMDKIPLNAHVKIDRRRVRAMYDEGALR